MGIYDSDNKDAVPGGAYQFESLEELKAAYKSGQVSPDGAWSFLQTQFSMIPLQANDTIKQWGE